MINEDNDLLVEKNHLARSKSRSLIYDKNNLILNKTVYTNCKKRDNGCPPWLIQAEEINHDKKNKIVNYMMFRLCIFQNFFIQTQLLRDSLDF